MAVENRENDPLPEDVVWSSLTLGDHSGAQNVFFLESFFLQAVIKIVPALGCKSQGKVFDRLRRNTTIVQVFSGSRGFAEGFGKEQKRLVLHLTNCLTPLTGRLVFFVWCSQFNSGAFGQDCQCLFKLNTFNVHHKAEQISPGPASKAVVYLFYRTYHERRGFFCVKRTWRLIIRSRTFQLDVVPDYLYNIEPVSYFFNNAV